MVYSGLHLLGGQVRQLISNIILLMKRPKLKAVRNNILKSSNQSAKNIKTLKVAK